MEVRVLGDLAVVDDRGTAHVVAGDRQRLLLAALAADRGRLVPSGRLVDLLWGDDLPAKPANALQSQVSRLRRLCAEAGAADAIEHRDGGYVLRADVVLDADRFESAISAGSPEAALAAWTGEPYPGIDAIALSVERRRLVELAAGAREQQLAARLRSEDPAGLVGELEVLVAAEPLRERSWALLMEALHRCGRRADALAAYQRARHLLADELGIDPGAELQELERRVLGESGPPEELPGVGAPRRVRHRADTPLIGRLDELSRLRELVGVSRCVTITGPGGVGKTRLLRELAAEVGDAAVFVALADLTEGVAERVAQDLGLRQAGVVATPLLQQIVVAVDGRRLVLAVDNAEHVSDEVADVVSELIDRTDATVVVTSRERIGVRGEHQLPLDPFEVPDDPGADQPAVALFVERARAVRPGWTPDADQLAQVGEVCRRLDGLPLAIELAAAQLAAIDVPDLLDRLDPTRLQGRTGGPEHHRSLTAMLDWSYDRLSAEERIALDRMSVLLGTASLAGVEAVVAGDGIAREDVAPILVRLVERSLVRAVDVDGRRRFDLLVIVRAHVNRRADPEVVDGAARRFIAWAIGVAEDADEQIRGRHAGQAWSTFAIEHDALLGAMETARRMELDVELARLVRFTVWWWFVSGRHDTAQPWVRLVHVRDAGHPLDVGVARGIGSLIGLDADRTGLAAIARRTAQGHDPRWDLLLRIAEAFSQAVTGEQAAAIDTSVQVKEMAADLGDTWLEGAAGLILCTALFWSGEVHQSLPIVDEALDTAVRNGDPWLRVHLLANRSASFEVLGDLPRSRADIEEALDLAADRFDTAMPEAPIRLADIAVLEGDAEAGFRLATEAIERVRAVGAVAWLGGAYATRGFAARRLGRIEEARADFEQSLASFRATGFDVGVGLALSGLGYCAEQLGDLELARELHTDGMQVAKAFGDPRAVAFAHEGLAAVDAAEGDPLGALRQLSEAARLRREVGAPLPTGERHDVDRVEQAIRSALGDEVVDLALGG